MEYNNPEGYGTRDPGTPPGPKKDFEEKLDEIADEVSRTVSEGVKRLEETVSNINSGIKERPEVSESKLRAFFTSPMGGLVVLVIGLLWFFNAVGLFDNKVLPVILIAVGIYMMVKFNSDRPER